MSSPASSIHHLPDVLTQLVMQSLKLSELLQFARCSRSIAKQADSDFAFRHVDPLVRLWNERSPPICLGKLMLHVPLTLQPTLNSNRLATLLPQLPAHLYGLDASKISVSVPECVRLLSHPSLRSLIQLTVNNHGSWCQRKAFLAMSRLSRLHTVCLLGFDDDGIPPAMDALKLLANCPAITALRIRDRNFRPPSRLAGLIAFPSLKHLTVRQPWIHDDEWVAHFASPGLSQLTSLTFDWCIFSGPSNCKPLNPDYAAAVFTSLTHLSSLHLKMPFGIDLILPSLRCARALTTLRVEACCSSGDAWASQVLPSFAVLRPLMIAQPQLRVEIDLRDHESPLRDEYVPKLATDFAAVPGDVRSRLTVLPLDRCIGLRLMSSPILRLSQTELRLVAHLLDANRILQLAQCCKALMAAVDSPFTFKHCAPLAVTCNGGLLRLSSASRHCPLRVRWLLPESSLVATENDVWPLQGSNLNIRSFDSSACFHVPVRLWLSLLADPAISRVQELIVHRSDRQMSMDWTFLDRLTKMPCLQSLSLGRTSDKARWTWDRLTPPASLTSLRITDASPAPVDPAKKVLSADSCLSWIAQCTGLKSLHLSRPRLFNAAGPNHCVTSLIFFQSAAMRGLLELKLESWVVASPNDDSLISAFQRLSSLRSLHLLRCTLDAPHLVAVSSPPALRTLILETGFRPGNRWKRELELPDEFDFMEERPLLHVIIRTRPDSASLSGAASAAFFARMQPCLQRFPDHLRIETGEVPSKLRRRERGHEMVPRFDRGLRKERRLTISPQVIPLDRTPDAIVQFLMQRTDLRSLLIFARCSRRLRALADAPHVWLHLKRSLTEALLPWTRTRLLRHIPLTVNCHRFGGVGFFDRAIRAYPFLNVVEVDTIYPTRHWSYYKSSYACQHYDAACERLLQRSAMLRVEVLRLDYHSSLGYLAQCGGSRILPRLRVLQFQHIAFDFGPHAPFCPIK